MLTGKTANNGYVVTFSHKRNKKLQGVNLQWKRVYWPEAERWVRLRICTRVSSPSPPPLPLLPSSPVFSLPSALGGLTTFHLITMCRLDLPIGRLSATRHCHALKSFNLCATIPIHINGLIINIINVTDLMTILEVLEIQQTG